MVKKYPVYPYIIKNTCDRERKGKPPTIHTVVSWVKLIFRFHIKTVQMESFVIVVSGSFIVNITNVYFLCLCGLDGYLVAIFHSVRFCAKLWLILRDLKSLSTTWYQVFLPFNCCISTASLYMAKPPQSASSNAVPNAIKAQMLPQFWRRLPILT